jgi:hypothetical protein
LQGGVLGEYRNSTLALENVRVHDPVRRRGTWAERPGLLQQFVDERSLAMVDMRNDGDVSYVLSVGHLEVFIGRGGGL